MSTTPITAETIARLKEFRSATEKACKAGSYENAFIRVEKYTSTSTREDKRGRTFLTCGLAANQGDVRTDVYFEIEIDEAVVTLYSSGFESCARFVAVSSIYRYAGSQFFTSLLNILRPGDRIVTTFVVGNTTEALRAAGFRMDECYVDIVRKGKLFVRLSVYGNTVPANSTVGLADFSAFS